MSEREKIHVEKVLKGILWRLIKKKSCKKFHFHVSSNFFFQKNDDVKKERKIHEYPFCTAAAAASAI